MSSKVMVIISTAEKAKALTGIMYAVNAQKHKSDLLKTFCVKMRTS